MSINHRYDGRPLVRLLELYALSAIGELSKEDSDRMTAMTPKLREVYGHSGEWPEIIAAAAALAQETPSEIRGMWERNQEIARSNGVILSPQQFAEMFVNDNF